MELERPLPQPITPEAKPYWDGLREQKLMLPRCRACRRAFFYPRVVCPHCHASDIEWFQASGRGKLFSFEIGDGTAEVMKTIVARELMGRESRPY